MISQNWREINKSAFREPFELSMTKAGRPPFLAVFVPCWIDRPLPAYDKVGAMAMALDCGGDWARIYFYSTFSLKMGTNEQIGAFNL